MTVTQPEVESVLHGTVLHIGGALRAPNMSELTDRAGALLRRGERRVLIDLSGVEELDAAGLGELVEVHNRIRAASGVMRIVNATNRIRTLLARTGLLRVLNVDPPSDLDGAENVALCPSASACAELA
jgi:anti-sigma B factor antagonist